MAAASAQLSFLMDAAHLLRQSAPETSAYLMRRRMDLVSGTSMTATTANAVSAATSATGTLLAAAQQKDAHRQHICACCGHIMIPGCDGTTLTIAPGRPLAKNKKKRKRGHDRAPGQDDSQQKLATAAKPEKMPKVMPHAGITKVFTCGACGRETKVALPPPPPLPKPRGPNAEAAEKKAGQRRTAAEQATANASTSKTAPAPATAAKTPAAAAAPAKTSSNASSKKRAKDRKAGLLALLDKSRETESGSFGGLNLSFDDFRRK